jgi:hypothetical protein
MLKLSRTYKHLLTTMRRITLSPEIVTLVVGAAQDRVSCHKTLLGFYSQYFEAALYSGFSESISSEMPLPEDNFAGAQKFVAWLYTGRVSWVAGESPVDMRLDNGDGYESGNHDDKKCEFYSGETVTAHTWIFADRMMAPRFANYAMEILCDLYDEQDCSAHEAVYAFENSIPNSKIRHFFRDMIAYAGPFSPKRDLPWGSHDAWEKVLERGGEVVKACAKIGFSQDLELEKAPWTPENRQKYMVDMDELDPVGWYDNMKAKISKFVSEASLLD